MFRITAVIDDKTCDTCRAEHNLIINENELDSRTGENCQNLNTEVKCRCTVEKMWLCDWCKIYGKSPVTLCWHPVSEPKTRTAEGDEICQTCVKTWQEGQTKI